MMILTSANIRITLVPLLLPVFAFLAAPALQAQDLDTVTITGRVFDQNRALIAGAEVTATLTRNNLTRTTVTDAEGRFSLIQLEPGNFTVTVRAPSFSVFERKELFTVSAQTVRLEITLLPESITAQALVIDVGEPELDTTRTIIGGTIGSAQIESLPLSSRSPLDLVFILPGVTEEPLSTRDLAEDRNVFSANTPEEAGTFGLSGGPAYSNNITIDGLDNNDDRAARERFQPSLEAIEEVQVITNQFSAEYGRASGGRVNLRTKGGGNTFHGRGFYFFRDEALNANTSRNNMLGLKRLPLQQHNPGVALGGPLAIPGIVNLRQTKFFASYEFDTSLDNALVDTLVPVEQNSVFSLPQPTHLTGRRREDANEPALSAEVAPFIASLSTPIRDHRFSIRLDHQFSQLHNVSFTYHAGRLVNLRQFGGGNRLAETLQGRTRDSDALAYVDNYVFSPRLVNQVRAQWSRLIPAVGKNVANNPVVLIALNDPLLLGDPARRSGTLVAGASTSGASGRREQRLQIQQILSLVNESHSFKIGFDGQRIRSTFIDLADASGTFNFASAGDFLASIPSRYRQNFLTASTQRNTYLGIFAQDEWRPFTNLTISFGLRYENESIVDDRNNFAPRLSVAYDPFGAGHTVIRLGAGVFYNRALLRTIDDFTLGAQQLFFDTNRLVDPTTGKLLTATQRRAFIAANLSFPRTLRLDSSLVREFAVLNSGFSRRLDPRLRIPESYQANVGIERASGGFVLEANYALNRGVHLWREFNANAPKLPVGYQNFTAYLISRDFANFRAGPNGLRPIYDASTAGELVRFVLAGPDPAASNTVGRVIESGVTVSLINLNSFNSSTALEAALAALNDLRPDPTRAEVEQLISAGNSFYHGLSLELRKRFSAKGGISGFLRASYTFSHLTDDGVVNTSDALQPGNFRAERARSLLDRRHRLVVSGTVSLPRHLARINLSPILRLASGAPFNISLGGSDRNLDDVGNDRPIFNGRGSELHWRAPGSPLDEHLLDEIALPTIGSTGNLPRNAGRGPSLFIFDLNVSRELRVGKMRLRPVIELDNVLNKTVFSFGSEFINFTALAPTATPEQRQAFLDGFLVATRTMRPRQIRLGMRLDF